ncbi:MAG: glycosyltransferase [Bacteroidales bacterium]|nr:glycosyltransferase [Bacteroidales bacterium]
MNNFNVSVIIPVLNREKFIERAIMSAVTLECVKEIIVIDDGSTDSSFSICQHLSSIYPKIRVLSHAGHQNKGVSASRNLGIASAKFEFVAFLDSDDYYLENRFDFEKELYKTKPMFDGVYGASEWVWVEQSKKELYTIKSHTDPSELFKVLLWQNKGLFDTNTITIRKTLLDRIGYFDEYMPVAEDTELWYRTAAYGNIYTGNIYEPIAVRIIHSNNAVINLADKYNHYYKYMYKKMLKHYLFSRHISFNNKNEILLMLNNYQKLFDKVYPEKEFVAKLMRHYPFLWFCPFIYRLFFKL